MAQAFPSQDEKTASRLYSGHEERRYISVYLCVRVPNLYHARTGKTSKGTRLSLLPRVQEIIFFSVSLSHIVLPPPPLPPAAIPGLRRRRSLASTSDACLVTHRTDCMCVKRGGPCFREAQYHIISYSSIYLLVTSSRALLLWKGGRGGLVLAHQYVSWRRPRSFPLRPR